MLVLTMLMGLVLSGNEATSSGAVAPADEPAGEGTCPEPALEMRGQPGCVQVEMVGETTRVTNTCEEPVLIDQAVRLVSLDGGPPPLSGLIPPGSSATLDKKRSFTLGMSGKLHRVAQTRVPAEGCAEGTQEGPKLAGS